jgi:hypothetical protein
VQPAPFLIFIIGSRTRIVKRQNFQNTKDKNGPPASAFSCWGGRSDTFQRILMQSDVFIRSLKNNADASFFLYSGVIFAFCGISKRTVFALLSFHDFPAHASLAGLHLDYRGIVLQCQ